MSMTVITIDGPSGSGKGTLAARVAVHYGFHLLDSGALYRILGLAAHRQNLLTPQLNVDALANLARQLDIQFVPDQQQRLNVLLNGENISSDIRTETVGQYASRIAVIPEVRQALLERQRDFARAPGLVADGRDMGTVVFMDAPVKIYLTATADARAERRFKQLQQMGVDARLEDIFDDLVARDRRDMDREVAPLRPAADAYTIDSSTIGIDEVFDLITAYADQQIPAVS
jgi:cytidylate kinase